MSSPPTVTSADLAFIRDKTNGAAGWTDDTLTVLAQQWTTSQEAMDEAATAHGQREEPEETPDVETTEATVALDLWAAAAMVLEYRLLKALEDPVTGTTQARTGDAHLQFERTSSSTWLLRVYIRRYWRQADPANRALVHPSGWRSIDTHQARRWQLIFAPMQGIAINGPGVGVDAVQGP